MNMLSGLRPPGSQLLRDACRLRGEQLAAASSERGLRAWRLRHACYRAVHRPAWYEVRIVFIFIFVLRIVSY